MISSGTVFQVVFLGLLLLCSSTGVLAHEGFPPETTAVIEPKETLTPPVTSQGEAAAAAAGNQSATDSPATPLAPPSNEWTTLIPFEPTPGSEDAPPEKPCVLPPSPPDPLAAFHHHDPHQRILHRLVIHHPPGVPEEALLHIRLKYQHLPVSADWLHQLLQELNTMARRYYPNGELVFLAPLEGLEPRVLEVHWQLNQAASLEEIDLTANVTRPTATTTSRPLSSPVALPQRVQEGQVSGALLHGSLTAWQPGAAVGSRRAEPASFLLDHPRPDQLAGGYRPMPHVTAGQQTLFQGVFLPHDQLTTRWRFAYPEWGMGQRYEAGLGAHDLRLALDWEQEQRGSTLGFDPLEQRHLNLQVRPEVGLTLWEQGPWQLRGTLGGRLRHASDWRQTSDELSLLNLYSVEPQLTLLHQGAQAHAQQSLSLSVEAGLLEEEQQAASHPTSPTFQTLRARWQQSLAGPHDSIFRWQLQTQWTNNTLPAMLQLNLRPTWMGGRGLVVNNGVALGGEWDLPLTFWAHCPTGMPHLVVYSNAGMGLDWMDGSRPNTDSRPMWVGVGVGIRSGRFRFSLGQSLLAVPGEAAAWGFGRGRVQLDLQAELR